VEPTLTDDTSLLFTEALTRAREDMLAPRAVSCQHENHRRRTGFQRGIEGHGPGHDRSGIDPRAGRCWADESTALVEAAAVDRPRARRSSAVGTR